MRIHALSTDCDVISFFCLLTCADWKDLSNHTRMSTIQSRTPEKTARNHLTLTWKFPRKFCSTAHLPFLSSNPKILKEFLKPLPTKMKSTKCLEREQKRQEKRRKRGGDNAKSKHQDCCVTFKPQNYLGILLFAHARTSQAKAAKCTTCKRLAGTC